MRLGILLFLTSFATASGTTAVQGQALPPGFEATASASVVGQATSEDETRSELVASVDLFADVLLGGPRLHVYVEANTTPRARGVSTRIPFGNMDAGTALDGEGRGRVQVSELRIAWPLPKRAVLHTGLMDLTGFLDVSRIANDENLHFLAQPFVNNPTIVFPDYTLGSVLVVGEPGPPGAQLALAVSRSAGLGDDPTASYGQLFAFDGSDGGVFTAARIRLARDRWRGSLGGWTSTGERRVGSALEPLPTRGVFMVVGASAGPHELSARLGLAGGDSSRESFVGLTYLGTLGSNAVGIGVGTGPALPVYVGRHAEHVETFVRRSIWNLVHLTSSVQWLSEAFLPRPGNGGIWIFGFRLSAIVL